MLRSRALRGLVALGLVALGLAAAGCGGSSSGKPGATGSNCSKVVPTPSGTPQQYSSEPPLCIDPTTYTATIVTNQGTVVASLDGKNAPHTVNSFKFLADHHYFDKSPCHRLTTRGIFVLQCGDPTGQGTGGPGYTIPDENLSGATYPAGTLAMANTGQPHTGGSQFFICYAATPLPPQYTPFGKVTSGLDVLLKIAKNGEDDANGAGDGHPKQPVVIQTFTVTKA
ncbi:MAG: peptidyl-prolyl cis-trans isomerase [Frankiaceae bacterium]|jgi:peptidyl-prolyl cis-trans isomerase B (cyclophilin B)|nr:peptidyl-prolyl cis-trans isomerase [Frankiaceae bacterium]